MLSSRTMAFASGIFPAVVMVAGSGVVAAQDYPAKTVRIVAAAAGGGGDFQGRLLAQAISGPLGQPVIVENRGSSLLSAETVQKAPPDGYTLLVQGASLWVSGLMMQLSYDAVRDFAPIVHISREVFLLAVHPSMPVKTVKELIALAKARPGQLDFVTGSAGGPGHLGLELFNAMAGVKLTRIAYKGTAPSVTGLISGDGHVTIADSPLVMPHTKSGKLRALAVTSATPSALAPGMPTLAESGVPGFEQVGASGIWAPVKTPAAIINRLSQEMARYLRTPEARDRLLSAQLDVVGGTPEQFDAFIKSDIAKWNKVIKDAGIKLN
jgi:tripartite-type tricarboxylate transporter receptor subunit TctC